MNASPSGYSFPLPAVRPPLSAPRCRLPAVGSPLSAPRGADMPLLAAALIEEALAFHRRATAQA
jgi:hypothetical protein